MSSNGEFSDFFSNPLYEGIQSSEFNDEPMIEDKTQAIGKSILSDPNLPHALNNFNASPMEVHETEKKTGELFNSLSRGEIEDPVAFHKNILNEIHVCIESQGSDYAIWRKMAQKNPYLELFRDSKYFTSPEGFEVSRQWENSLRIIKNKNPEIIVEYLSLIDKCPNNMPKYAMISVVKEEKGSFPLYLIFEDKAAKKNFSHLDSSNKLSFFLSFFESKVTVDSFNPSKSSLFSFQDWSKNEVTELLDWYDSNQDPEIKEILKTSDKEQIKEINKNLNELVNAFREFEKFEKSTKDSKNITEYLNRKVENNERLFRFEYPSFFEGVGSFRLFLFCKKRPELISDFLRREILTKFIEIPMLYQAAQLFQDKDRSHILQIIDFSIRIEHDLDKGNSIIKSFFPRPLELLGCGNDLIMNHIFRDPGAWKEITLNEENSSNTYNLLSPELNQLAQISTRLRMVGTAFGLDGTVTSDTEHIFPLEGYVRIDSLEEMKEIFSRFILNLKEFSGDEFKGIEKTLEDGLEVAQSDVARSTSLININQEKNKPSLIMRGFESHTTSWVIFDKGKKIAICNKGHDVYKIEDEFATGVNIFKVSDTFSWNEEKVEMLKSSDKSDSTLIDEWNLSHIAHTIEAKPQKSGNCTRASLKNAIRFLLLTHFDKDSVKANQVYKKYTSFMRDQFLDKILNDKTFLKKQYRDRLLLRILLKTSSSPKNDNKRKEKIINYFKENHEDNELIMSLVDPRYGGISPEDISILRNLSEEFLSLNSHWKKSFEEQENL